MFALPPPSRVFLPLLPPPLAAPPLLLEQRSTAVGVEALMGLLKNYCRAGNPDGSGGGSKLSIQVQPIYPVTGGSAPNVLSFLHLLLPEAAVW